MAATVAMIGVTHPHASAYLETLDELDEVGSVHLYDPEPTAAHAVVERCPKAAGVATDLPALLARPDLTHVLVAMPNAQTPAILVQAIEAGKAVFSEKPCARTAAEFAPVLAALARRPVPFGVAYLNRWNPAFQQMRQLYQAGAIGRLTSVELRMVTTQPRFRNPQHWLFNHEMAGGGILAWLACHWLDLVTFLTGEEIARVSAQLATTSGEAITVEDTAAVSFQLAHGAIGSLHAGYLLAVGGSGYFGGPYDMAVILRGVDGAMTYSRTVEEAPIVLETRAAGWHAATRRTFGLTQPRARGYGGQHGLDFVRAWLLAGPTDATPADAIDAHRILNLLDAIYAANRTGSVTTPQPTAQRTARSH